MKRKPPKFKKSGIVYFSDFLHLTCITFVIRKIVNLKKKKSAWRKSRVYNRRRNELHVTKFDFPIILVHYAFRKLQ